MAIDATGEGKTRWNAVKEVTYTPERIFIQLVSGTGHVIPCRAFASPEEAARFAQTVNDYLKAAA